MVGAAFALCLAAGVLLNAMRPEPLPLRYAPLSERIGGEDAGHPVVTQSGARRALAEGRAVFIDARPPDFYEEGHIPGAINLPVAEALGGDLRGLPESRRTPLIVYCSGGDCEDSRIVLGALLRNGFTDVSIFEGGWDEWSAGEEAR